MTDSPTTPGARLVHFRACLGLSQRALAEQIGVSNALIGNCELGHFPPSRSMLQRLYATFGLSADWLLHGAGEMVRPEDGTIGLAGRRSQAASGPADAIPNPEQGGVRSPLRRLRDLRGSGMTDSPTTPGARLVHFRACLGLSQRALAEQIGVSNALIGNCELGHFPPSRSMLQRLYATFGLSADWLLHGAGEMVRPEDGTIGLAGRRSQAASGPADAIPNPEQGGVRSPVPQEWTDMIGHLREAQVASDTMRSPTATQVDRDLATVAYSRAVDRMFAKLSLLSERQVLGRITMFLARRERS